MCHIWVIYEQSCSQDQQWQDQDQDQDRTLRDQDQDQDQCWQDQDQDRDRTLRDQDQDRDQYWRDQDRDQDQNNYFTSDLKTISNENVLLMYADDANLVVSQKSKSSIYMFIGYIIIVLFEYY